MNRPMTPSRSVTILLFVLAAVGLHSGSILSAQPATGTPAGPALLTVTGESGKVLHLTAADLEKLPRQTIQATDRGEESASYEGVSLVELLKLAGAPLGDALGHGDAPSWYVVVEAKDGYRAVFALAELDPAFTDRSVFLVDRKAGKALEDTEGPLRLVVPGEKRHARWVRQVTGLRIGRI